MTPVNVLVVFYSRYGQTERLALAAGLGAIEAEGNIRLRRVADLAAPPQIEADAEWCRCLARRALRDQGTAAMRAATRTKRLSATKAHWRRRKATQDRPTDFCCAYANLPDSDKHPVHAGELGKNVEPAIHLT